MRRRAKNLPPPPPSILRILRNSPLWCILFDTLLQLGTKDYYVHDQESIMLTYGSRSSPIPLFLEHIPMNTKYALQCLKERELSIHIFIQAYNNNYQTINVKKFRMQYRS